MEGLRPLLFGGLQEKWSREMMRHHEGGGGASQLVYVHVTWTLSSCGLPLLPLCLIISPLSRNLPPSHQTDGSTHMAVLSPSLPLHHPNALWQCRLLCSLLNGKPEIIPKLEISLPLSLCHIHPFFLFFSFSLLLRAVARVFASTNVSTPNMHVFCQQNSLDWHPVDA